MSGQNRYQIDGLHEYSRWDDYGVSRGDTWQEAIHNFWNLGGKMVGMLHIR